MPISPVSISTIEAVAAILGETDGGLTNSEIGKLLASANIADPRAKAEQASPEVRAGLAYIKMSKVDRIRGALGSHQSRTGTGDALVGFLHAAIDPQRYVGEPGLFAFGRDRLNEILVFEGLELQDDGRLHRRTQRARTLDEAAALAGVVSAELRRRETHPQVLAYCNAEVLARNNFHACLEVTKGIFDRVRRDLDLKSDGADLVDEAFAFRSSAPRLVLSELESETGRAEQSGFMNLIKGLHSMFRSPIAHEARVTREAVRPITDTELLELFTTVSMVHNRLDQCSRPVDKTSDSPRHG